MDLLQWWPLVFAILLISEIEAFIPRECHHLKLPRSCRCRFYDRPLVSCRGNYTEPPTFPKPKWFDAKKIHTLDLSHNRIVYIGSDICEYCVGIKRLDLSHNRISKVLRYDFFKSGWRYDLEYLDLSYNEMHGSTMIGLANLENLKTLKLDHNKIMMIGSDTMPRMQNLEMLTLNNNRLFSLQLKKVHPKVLHVSVMALSKTTLPSGIEELVITRSYGLLDQTLTVDSSAFKYVALESCGLNASVIVNSGFFEDTPHLKHLSLKANRLSSSDSENFNRLMTQVKDVEYLDLSRNEITEVTVDMFHPLTKLKHLNLSDNKIIKIEWTFLRALSHLESLDISDNNIMYSVGMKDPILSLTKMKSFSISNNPFNCACNDLRDLYELIKTSLQPPHLIEYNEVMQSLKCATPEGYKDENVLNFFEKNCQDIEDESVTVGSGDLQAQKITNTTPY